MGAVLLMVVSFAGYLVAYHTYGKFLARKIFHLRPDAPVPSREKEDGLDYVPTRKGIIFGHHYTSIAGTGPIVGPAIGIIWGWLPAMVWVLVGSIVMGAVHDLGALVVSLRHEGKSIAECAAQIVGPRVKYILFLIIFLGLLIVIAIFGLIIAVVFKMYPQSVFPVWMEIPIAMTLGWLVYKRNANVTLATVVAVTLMYVTVLMGHFELFQFSMPDLAGVAAKQAVEAGKTVEDVARWYVPATGVWTIVLLVYAFFASTLPVTTLLQPRDYINAWQLFIAMGLLVLGVLAAGLSGGLHLVAPAVNRAVPSDAPSVWPFLFITIACGAISGFHSLVSSGTTAKQVSRETDALFVGYGSMLLEGVLATLVIIAVAAGIGMAYQTKAGDILTGRAAWDAHYVSWAGAGGLGPKVQAMVIGSANMIASLGIPKSIGIIIMGVFIASFAGTTLDTATRIQRYVIAELFGDLKVTVMTNRYAATAFAVITAAVLAFCTGASGAGAMKLWPLFGAANQLLAALALLVITNYLKRKGGLKLLVTGIPCIVMLVITIWAVVVNELGFISNLRAALAAGDKGANWLLPVINGAILLLALWMVVESVLALARKSPTAA
ncbi:MAG: carbon starvation protein A [Kiritimatiellae bacterium]|nr:carbon starvation protein A [Kiritimatiellia bacterium]